MLSEPEIGDERSTPTLKIAGRTGSAVSFTLLGPVEVRKDGNNHAPTAPKVLQLLALLLMRPGQTVHTDTIVQELWSGRPPRSVRTTLQTYVYQLRKCLHHNGLIPETEQLLLTRTPGYALQVHPDQVDVYAFHELCRQAKDSLKEMDYDGAARGLRAALARWSGRPLANVDCGPILTAFTVDLEEQHRTALHLRIQAELEGGKHRDVLGELRSLVTINPLDEGMQGLLIRALNASGRRSDAMAAYHALRSMLNRDLGVEPCQELQSLYRELLSVRPDRAAS